MQVRRPGGSQVQTRGGFHPLTSANAVRRYAGNQSNKRHHRSLHVGDVDMGRAAGPRNRALWLYALI
jgi:hypothetical protein